MPRPANRRGWHRPAPPQVRTFGNRGSVKRRGQNHVCSLVFPGGGSHAPCDRRSWTCPRPEVAITVVDPGPRLLHPGRAAVRGASAATTVPKDYQGRRSSRASSIPATSRLARTGHRGSRAPGTTAAGTRHRSNHHDWGDEPLSRDGHRRTPAGSPLAPTVLCGSPTRPTTPSGGSRPQEKSGNFTGTGIDALGHHGWTRRCPVVHQRGKRLDRQDHDGGSGTIFSATGITQSTSIVADPMMPCGSRTGSTT